MVGCWKDTQQNVVLGIYCLLKRKINVVTLKKKINYIEFELINKHDPVLSRTLQW